jgi:hypothetical protein
MKVVVDKVSAVIVIIGLIVIGLIAYYDVSHGQSIVDSCNDHWRAEWLSKCLYWDADQSDWPYYNISEVSEGEGNQ